MTRPKKPPKPTPKPKRPSFAAALQASIKNNTPCKWSFPKAALANIAEVREVNEQGEVFVPAMAVARALKATYAIPVSVKTIAKRLADMHGGKW
jgi:hypothetical protein